MNARVVNWWKDTIETYPDGYDEILVVAHGGSLRCLLAYFDGANLSEAIHGYYTHNCSVTTVEVEDSKTSVIEVDSVTHL